MPNSVYLTIYILFPSQGKGGNQARDIFIPKPINHYVRRSESGGPSKKHIHPAINQSTVMLGGGPLLLRIPQLIVMQKKRLNIKPSIKTMIISRKCIGLG